MIAGHLQIKNDNYYMVLNYTDANGKRRQPWIPTGLLAKGNKRRAEKLLLDEGGLVPLYYDNSQIYVQSYVSGLSMPMFGSDFEFSRVKILAH